MAERQPNFNLHCENDVQRLTEILFCDRSESDYENVNEFGDESDTEGEDNLDERVENSESEQSDEEDISSAILEDSRPNDQHSSSSFQQVQSQPQTITQQQQVDSNENLFITANFGKDNVLKWYLRPRPQNQKTLPQNIIRRLPGVIGPAKQSKTPLECWSNFFTDSMLEKIIRFTNQYIERVQENFNRIRDAKFTDIQEIKACIGLLYLLGVNRSNRQSLEEVWATDGTGIEKCRLTMSLRRFKFLLRCLRFDDLATRALRRQTDNLAAIRELFEDFVKNCKKAYSLGENVTIDEKLEAFRGRCRFRQYIPSKPAKYGIKIFALCDSKTFYTSNLEIYCGKQPEGPWKISNKSEDVVKRMSEHIYGSGRNITADNWFSAVDLVDFLKSKKLSYVGTLKKNRKGIPAELKNIKHRPLNSSFFVFSDNSSIVSFVPAPKKNVLLISSLHHDDEVCEENNKPDIIIHYNNTKSGVDCVDKLCSTYNVARNTRRWPMVVFFAMCNVGGINALVVSFGNGMENTKRRCFLRKLSEELISEHIQRRSETTVRGGMSCALQKSLKRYKPNPEEDRPTIAGSNQLEKRVKCRPCSEEKRSRVTKYICYQCKRACRKGVRGMCPKTETKPG